VWIWLNVWGTWPTIVCNTVDSTGTVEGKTQVVEESTVAGTGTGAGIGSGTVGATVSSSPAIVALPLGRAESVGTSLAGRQTILWHFPQVLPMISHTWPGGQLQIGAGEHFMQLKAAASWSVRALQQEKKSARVRAVRKKRELCISMLEVELVVVFYKRRWKVVSEAKCDKGPGHQ
jgi:hypothetical protein